MSIFKHKKLKRKERLLELEKLNFNNLTFDEKIELISCRYYEKQKITYEEFVVLAMFDEVEFFYKGMLYQIDYSIPEFTSLYITPYPNGTKVLGKSIKFNSILELFAQFRVEGKRICDIWDEIAL